MTRRILFIIAVALLLGALTASAVFAATRIKIDGSSTVYLITEAVAEEFGKANKDVQVTVGISGTGGGFKKFCVGETDISDASRQIKASELTAAKNNNINFIELPVAYDGLALIVHKQNTWCKDITAGELKKIWEPGSTVKKWNDVRSSWPDKPIKLYGPGTDSGTFDYFTEVICGKSGASRSDYTASEDDNVLVQGIAGDPNSMGYFGLAYYEENANRLNLVKVNSVLPSAATVRNGSYKPLSRPLFIYVNAKSAQRPDIDSFIKFYLTHAKTLSAEVGYVPLEDSTYELAKIRFTNKVAGTMYKSPADARKPLNELMK